jgi:nucleoid-associated protein YejK
VSLQTWACLEQESESLCIVNQLMRCMGGVDGVSMSFDANLIKAKVHYQCTSIGQKSRGVLGPHFDSIQQTSRS